MSSVREVNDVFAKRGFKIKLPYPDDWLVKDIKVLEKRDTPTTKKLLLAVKLMDRGREMHDILSSECEASRQRKSWPIEWKGFLKSEGLPQDRGVELTDGKVQNYLRRAIVALLENNGYTTDEREGVDVYAQKNKRVFFIKIAVRCDAHGYQQARSLAELSKKFGHACDYGLVVPAFQDSLGVSTEEQESWIQSNSGYFSAHRIGIFAVDNREPGRIYPFTTYPQDRELMRYFINTSQQWSASRSRTGK